MDGHDLATYQILARYAKDFREDAWKPERRQRWSKYTLDMVEAEMKMYRLARMMETMARDDVLDETAREDQAESTASPLMQLP